MPVLSQDHGSVPVTIFHSLVSSVHEVAMPIQHQNYQLQIQLG